MPDSIEFKRECIEPGHPRLSVRRQCELLGLNRSSWYYEPLGESAENLAWMRRIDEQYLKTPCYGRRKMAEALGIDAKRAGRLMRLMGLEALEEALGGGTPEIFNTDQGVQYTAEGFTGRLEAAGVSVSMDGRGRWLDNVFVERLWRTVKYEHLYLHEYATPRALQVGLAGYFPFYNEERIHAALDYRTPRAVYLAA